MNKQNQTSRDLQAIHTKNKIYECALKLFDINGFANTTINQICKKAGVGIGTFYHHYKSKDDIVTKTFQNELDIFSKKQNDSLYSSYLDQVADFINTQAVYCQKNSSLLHLILRNGLSSKNPEDVTIFYRGFYDAIKESLDKAYDAGEINKNYDKDHLILFVDNIIIGTLFNWCYYNENFDLVERTNKSINEFIKMIQSSD